MSSVSFLFKWRETRDAKIEEVKEEEEEEEEEEEDTKQDDTMFGLDDVREAELRKHPKYRPQKCATVMGLKWDVRDSSFLANNQDMTRRRVEFCMATSSTAGYTFERATNLLNVDLRNTF